MNHHPQDRPSPCHAKTVPSSSVVLIDCPCALFCRGIVSPVEEPLYLMLGPEEGACQVAALATALGPGSGPSLPLAWQN